MERKKNELNRIDVDSTLPHQISAPSYKNTETKMEPPFTNRHGVIIGDSHYTSAESPLENWNDETDPSIMAGDEWVHPTNDIGWNTSENLELLEEQRNPKGYPFMHPTIDVSKGQD